MPNHQELLEILLKNREIDIKDYDRFLNPSYDNDLNDPFLMKDMERACVRIFEAIEAKEKIVIYSDYDCDGIPAAVLMHDFLKIIKYENFSVYIPDRQDEGYGLHSDAIDEFIRTGVNLIITFDLGITAIEEVSKAKSAGIDTIITDHHLVQDTEIPRAYAVLNPKQDDCDYPDKMICGAGIAYKLVQGLIKKYGEYWQIKDGWDKWLLDLVGIATLSDQVPLLGENRVFAFYGLKVLQKTRRLGLIELFTKSKIDIKKITEEDITFTLAPRLNAASRMASPMSAFKLLSTKDQVEARTLADHLSEINDDRKKIVAQIMKEVKKVLSKRFLEEDKPFIVIGNPNWKTGILGIIASKIVDEYGKTVFVWGGDGSKVIKGSCRTCGDVDLVEIMNSLPKDSLISFGGHKMAGGFSVDYKEIHFLEERLSDFFNNKEDVKKEDSEIMIDTIIELKDINEDNYKVIEKLAPYGSGNPKPTFLLKDVIINEVKEFGKDKNHLELSFKSDYGKKVKAIAFFKNRESFGRVLSVSDKVSMIVNFEKSFFLGKTELRLRIVNIL